MKRIWIAWLLLLCLGLSACGNFELPELEDLEETAGIITDTRPMADTTAPATAAPTTVAPTTLPATEPPAKPTEPSKPGMQYKTVDPYPIPIANPDKPIYDMPGGKIVGTFGSIGYHTIVEEAKDAQNYTWGKLGGGQGGTLVYQQVLPELDMFFGSGVGAWGTVMHLDGNGKFSGNYHDSDMGDIGDGYPNGTCYICDFNGRFRIDDIDGTAVYLELTSLDIEVQPGKEWIEDGILYVASGAYGLDGGDRFVLYTPQTPVSQLPEDMRYWSYSIPATGTLGCYALYCPDAGTAFFNG
jgi:hypothetical protein